MAFQCNNEALKAANEIPSDRVSVDGCRTGVGVDNLHLKCRDILFTWAPGSQGEALPNGKGIKANKARNCSKIIL
jgi:hypothetical protein